MTDFRQRRASKRIQWRYRSGFTPDSLFSHQSPGAMTSTQTLIQFAKRITQSAHFVNTVFIAFRYILFPDPTAPRLTNALCDNTIALLIKNCFKCSARLRCHAGRIDNRVKLPGGTAAVSAEAGRRTKVGHWNIRFREGAPVPMMREPEDLLEDGALPKV